jgi:hypothetical protein
VSIGTSRREVVVPEEDRELSGRFRGGYWWRTYDPSGIAMCPRRKLAVGLQCRNIGVYVAAKAKSGSPGV